MCGVRDGRDGRDASPETPIEIERSRSNDCAIERSIGARAGGTRRAGRAPRHRRTRAAPRASRACARRGSATFAHVEGNYATHVRARAGAATRATEKTLDAFVEAFGELEKVCDLKREDGAHVSLSRTFACVTGRLGAVVREFEGES